MCFVSLSSSLFWQAVANNLALSLLFEISKTSDIKSSPLVMATPVEDFHAREYKIEDFWLMAYLGALSM